MCVPNRVGSAARKGPKHMTLEQLRVFVVVAELQHVTRAAAVLNLAQSAVSAAIAALEARHGAFRHKYPGIDIRVTIGNTAQVAAAVHEGAADLGFIEGMIEDPMLTKEQVARDQMVIVVGTEHAWSTIDRLEPERLIETDWVLREPGSGTRSAFEAASEGFGVSPGALRVALELPSNEALRAAVEAGLGATATSTAVASPL